MVFFWGVEVFAFFIKNAFPQKLWE